MYSNTLNASWEKKAYMVTLLHYLWVIKTSLEEQSQNDYLVYAKLLVQALLCGHEKRFAPLFQNRDILMATLLHSAFTLKAMENITPEKVDEIKDRIIRELRAVIKPSKEEQQQQRQPVQLEVQEPLGINSRLFNKLFARGPVSQQQDVRHVLRKSIWKWVPSKGELPGPFSPTSTERFEQTYS
ncbi:UNVERIFIED_CONTAM: hypothetical protein RMT77_005222 [Armadillidium vulgare]